MAIADDPLAFIREQEERVRDESILKALSQTAKTLDSTEWVEQESDNIIDPLNKRVKAIFGDGASITHFWGDDTFDVKVIDGDNVTIHANVDLFSEQSY